MCLLDNGDFHGVIVIKIHICFRATNRGQFLQKLPDVSTPSVGAILSGTAGLLFCCPLTTECVFRFIIQGRLIRIQYCCSVSVTYYTIVICYYCVIEVSCKFTFLLFLLNCKHVLHKCKFEINYFKIHENVCVS